MFITWNGLSREIKEEKRGVIGKINERYLKNCQESQ